jgi:hypothetical protein
MRLDSGLSGFLNASDAPRRLQRGGLFSYRVVLFLMGGVQARL